MLNHLGLGDYIADTVREPLLVLDAQFRVTGANRAYYAAFPSTPAQTIEKLLFELGEGEWDIPELRGLLLDVLPKHQQIESFAVEQRSARHGYRYLLLNACEIVRPEEHEYLILLAIDDITERRAAEVALAVRTTELERSNRELEQFAAIASHDLHEPLRKVRTYGDLILRAPEEALGATERGYVERMVHAATRMQTLINDLLALARLSAPRSPQPIDLNVTAREVLLDLEATVAAVHAKVTLGELPTVLGDATHLRQLLQNLLSNALKFHRMDVAPEICVETGAPRVDAHGREMIEVCVIDNGIGFDQRYAETIFEPLERLHGRSEYAGSGMGLALARRIAERHGGTITARSVPGQGTTFCSVLPRAAGAPIHQLRAGAVS